MPRLLSNKPCALELYDRISDSNLTLYYRLPKTAERVAYINEHVSRKGRKVKTSLGAPAVKWGKAIITGFKDGDFVLEKETLKEGNSEIEKVPISSDPSAPNYFPEWKDYLETHAADILMVLASHVFDSARLEGLQEDEEESPQEDPT